MCEQPAIPCDPCCQTEPVCAPQMRYIQPPRAVSFKPCISYKPPTLPVESETIYKKSYYCADPSVRARPIRPQNQLKTSNCPMDGNTTAALSYPGHFCVERQKPIIPCSPALLGEGPMQDLTTQKHDYVCKPFSKRKAVIPMGQIMRCCEPLSDKTINRLSFMTPTLNCPAVSCKPTVCYKRPELAIEHDTIQKLSYQPVCPPPKEDYPWARRSKFVQPVWENEKDTTYSLSYPKNCGDYRSQPIRPPTNPKLLSGDGNFCVSTIYKESYFCPNGQRPCPIRPKHNLVTSQCPMDPNTCYSLSYPGHFCIERQKPVKPCPPSLLNDGPMQDLTTQKHDFVCKPFSKRTPSIPVSNLKPSCCPMEKDTINRLSYVVPLMVKQHSFKPDIHYKRPELCMETDTIQKLSYQPVCPPARECLPWARRSSFKKPTIPMEVETVQKMSFGPPGCYVADANYSCGEPNPCCNYPRAAC